MGVTKFVLTILDNVEMHFLQCKIDKHVIREKLISLLSNVSIPTMFDYDVECQNYH